MTEPFYEIGQVLKIKNLEDVQIIGMNSTISQSNSMLDVISIEQSKNIEMKGIHLTHKETKYCMGRVLNVIKTESLLLDDVKLNGCGSIGLRSQYSKKILVQNCEIFNNSFRAVDVWQTDLEIINSSFYDNKRNEVYFNGKPYNSAVNEKFMTNYIILEGNTFQNSK